MTTLRFRLLPALLSALCACAGVSCSLQPQPEPPGESAGTAGVGGGAGSSGVDGGGGTLKTDAEAPPADGAIVGSDAGADSSNGGSGGADGADAAADHAADAAADQSLDATDDAPVEGSIDAPVEAAEGGEGGALACGSQTCGASQVCVHPCCGGPAPPCIAADDAGACPTGFHPFASCGGVSGPGCQADPCTPAPPTCKDLPSSCGNGVSCTCLPLDVCNPNSCGIVQGRDVSCICA